MWLQWLLCSEVTPLWHNSSCAACRQQTVWICCCCTMMALLMELYWLIQMDKLLSTSVWDSLRKPEGKHKQLLTSHALLSREPAIAYLNHTLFHAQLESTFVRWLKVSNTKGVATLFQNQGSSASSTGELCSPGYRASCVSWRKGWLFRETRPRKRDEEFRGSACKSNPVWGKAWEYN